MINSKIFKFTVLIFLFTCEIAFSATSSTNDSKNITDVFNQKPAGRYYIFLIEKSIAPIAPTCEMLGQKTKELNSNLDETPLVSCEVVSDIVSSELKTTQFVKSEINDLKLKPLQYTFLFTKKDEQTYSITVKNHHRPDNSDFESLTPWDIKGPRSKKANHKISKVLKTLFDLANYNAAIKTYWLANGLAKSSRFEMRSDGMVFDKNSGVVLSLRQAYKVFEGSGAREKNYLKGGLELAAILGGGQIFYWALHNDMVGDWDFEKKDMFTKKRVRYDDNALFFNFGHALAGWLYYDAARSNGFTALESTLVTFVTSTVWETVNEYHEVMSLNDEVFTGVGGAIVGETFFQIKNMLKAHKPGADVTKVITALYSPIDFIGSHFSNTKMAGIEKYGFESEEIAKFDFVYALGFAESTGSDNHRYLHLGFESEVLHLPTETQGQESYIANHIVGSKLEATLAESGVTYGQRRLFMQNILSAYFKKNMELDETQRLRGYSFVLGLAQSLEYQRTSIDNNDDFYAIVHVLGPTLDIITFFKDVRVRMSAQVFGDFSMVKVTAIEEYEKAVGTTAFNSSLNSLLRTHKYDYTYGVSYLSQLEVSYNQFNFGASYINADSQSVGGRSRYPTEKDMVADVTEQIHRSKVWVTYVPESFNWFEFGISVERIRRSGELYSHITKVLSKDHGQSIEYMAFGKYKFL